MNHPNGVYGYAGFYGMCLITNSWNVFILAVFSHICHLLFIYYVERSPPPSYFLSTLSFSQHRTC